MALHLTAALQHFLASLDGPAQERARESIAREAEAIRAAPPGPERARSLHRRLDTVIQEFFAQRPDLATAVRCGKGCSHCCRVFVGITRDEAQLLARWVQSGRIVLDAQRLEIQRRWTSPRDFAENPREAATCVFLQPDGACGVYEDRPLACRALLVASDPELCRRADRTTEILAIINPPAERLVSAAQSAGDSGGPNHLAARLWEALLMPAEEKPNRE
jgi:Fe-S-cluster containining protein